MKVRTEQKRDSIVEIAIGLFAEMGYEGASMNELARRAGGSKGTIYGYFPSKEALFEAVVRATATNHLAEAVRALPADVDTRESLESALRRFAERVLVGTMDGDRGLAVYRMIVAEAGRSDVGQLFYASGPRECMEALAKLLAVAMDRGLLRKADPRVTALHFISLATAENTERLYQRSPARLTPAQVRQMVKRAVVVFFAGAEAR
jgi:AcrR family transcriptional regulator